MPAVEAKLRGRIWAIVPIARELGRRYPVVSARFVAYLRAEAQSVSMICCLSCRFEFVSSMQKASDSRHRRHLLFTGARVLRGTMKKSMQIHGELFGNA